MPEATPATDAFRDLACPECGITLHVRSEAAGCEQCGRLFPLVGAIPCLMRDAGTWRTLWRSRLEDYRDVTEQRVREWQSEAEQRGLLPLTRKRLERLASAKQRELASVCSLLAPLGSGGPAPDVALPIASAHDAGNRLAVLECYENVFRDWAWGGAESERLLELVGPHVPKAAAKLAVFGAGAARFAVDVHCAFAPRRTFALDLNPLPLLVAERLARGESLELDEFPASPIGAAEAVIPAALSCPERPGPGFQLVFANALEPPFATESLDVVLAPWFVDVCGVDLRATLAIVNRVLAPGGTFVQLGPLDFNTLLSRVYSYEECIELFAEAGFEVTASGRTPLPYFDSPHSASRRIESVYLIAARKQRAAPATRIASGLPPWLEDTSLPVPLTPALTTLGQKSMLTAMVVGQIDGKRSIAELARMLSSSTGIDAARIEPELRILFGKLPAA